ncbi:MAG: lipoate--protein ligase family protein, partial [Candidatus Promineifilaceae bacterium]|nr:lipoate--protein ligase family protein [Candidatus Promineifilaceae bacterium]
MSEHERPVNWRVVSGEFLDGPTNMAIDEAILDAVSSGESPPTLRFYGWQPACVSLGFRQPIEVVDQRRLAERGWDLVRRPTGGRAILHVDELTYSICAPVNEPRVRGTVLQSYRRLSQGLLAGLKRLGLVEVSARQEGDSQTASTTSGPACFDNPADYEIVLGSQKLVGSAQVRRRQAVLQHGTLPLYGDVGRLADALHFEDSPARQQLARELRQRATTVAAGLGRRVTFDEAADALQRGLAEALDIHLEAGTLTGAELEMARSLRWGKY